MNRYAFLTGITKLSGTRAGVVRPGAPRMGLALSLCALLTLMSTPAMAHNLQTRMAYMFLDEQTQACIDARINGTPLPLGCKALTPAWTPGTPVLAQDDELGIITKVVPDPSGTTTGVGGHIDFYVPNGVQVIDVAYMVPDGNGNLVKAPMKGQSPIAVGAGPIGAKVTTQLIGLGGTYTNVNGVTEAPVVAGTGLHRGTIAGVYGDTGIFFSEDPDTAWGTWQDFVGNSANRNACGSTTYDTTLASTPNTKTITNNSGDTIVPCNKWDAGQLFAWGVKGTTCSIAGCTTAPIVDYGDGRGNAPWGFASGVAGPQSGYAWGFDWNDWRSSTKDAAAMQAAMAATKIGPWKRIQYPGSRVSFDQPGSASTVLGQASIDASGLGYTVDSLDQTKSDGGPKTIRYAVGQLTQNRPEYVWVKVKIKDLTQGPNNFLDASGCPVFRGDTFGGDAGGTDNGKDHLWRYYEPTVFKLNGCLAAAKPAEVEFAKVGDIVDYQVKAYNLGVQTLYDVTISDALPSSLQFLGASPAQSSGPSPLKWYVGTWEPGDIFEAALTVKILSTGQLSNCLTISGKDASNNAVTQSSCDITVTTPTPYLVQEKTANPTGIGPGGTVTYTLTVRNIGTGPTASPVTLTDSLPTGFAYGSLIGASVNGAVVTPTVTATNPSQPVFSLPASIAAGQSAVLTFIATTSANLEPGSYCNAYTVTQNGIPLTSGSLACVSVAGGQIGDTLFRDWNGNGVQDPGEEGLPGVTVTLSGTAKKSAITDANGNYLFSGLAAGDYTVTVPTAGNGGVPSGYTLTSVPPGQAGSSTSFSLTLSTNQKYLTADFGYQPGGSATIGDQVFEDKNGDGVFNGSDVGISGVTVRLYEDTNGNGKLDTGDNLIATTTTNASGTYLFNNTVAGIPNGLDPTRSYLVAAVDGTGSGVDDYFTPAYRLTTSNPWSVKPADFTAASNNVTTADFGYNAQTPGSIGDQVFIDSNGDGLYTAGEPGIANITVSLYIDLNGNGSADSNELLATDTTDGNGLYSFPNLGPANYIVVVDSADPDIPPGYKGTLDQIAYALAAGVNYTGADFPFRQLLPKTVDKASAANGNTLTFTLKPSYPGSDPLTSVRVLDPVPSNTTYLSSVPNATGAIGSTGAYVQIPAAQGADATIGTVDVSTSVTTLTQGGSVTVTAVVKNTTGSASGTVTPALTVSGGAASCGAPSPTSATIADKASQSFSWTCTLGAVAEYSFTVAASDGANDWPEGTSASVLSIASGGSTSNIVTWNLGSNTAGIPSETLVSGTVSGVYALAGKDPAKGGVATQLFSAYSFNSQAWFGKANTPAGVAKGGALTSNGSSKIYALEGNGTKLFWEYDIAGNTWSAKAAMTNNVGEGGALQYLTVGANSYVFALEGNNTTKFWRWMVPASGNGSWTAMADTPAVVKKGGALTTDGTYIYALAGNKTTAFWRCNATNTGTNTAGSCDKSWTVMASVPGAVGWGGSLVKLGNYLYALRGNNQTSFYRCNYTTTGSAGSCDTSWTVMATTPGNVNDGGSLTTDGTYIYALQGKTKAFWRYNVASDGWTTLADVNFASSVGQGGALTYVPGSGNAVTRGNKLEAPSLVTGGGGFQLTMTLDSTVGVTGVTPTLNTPTATGGAAATCTLQAPTTQNIAAGGTIRFTWKCTATPGSSPGSLTYTATATNGTVSWTQATSNSVLITPELKYTTTIGTFPASCLIPNTGIVADQGGNLGSAPSNTTQTSGASGSCTNSASIGDFVWADANGNGAQDSGETGIAGVRVYIDANGNGQYDSGETSAITDLSGAYHFYGLAGGTYTLRTDAATYPAGYTPTTPVFVTKTLAANTADNSFDFGLQAPGTGSIGDTVWLDSDSNGAQDAGETGLPGIVVKLYRDLTGNGLDASDPLVGTTTTDANGNYGFTDLPIGSGAGSPVKYLVQVDEANSSVAIPYPYSGGPTTATLGTALAPTTGTTNPRAVLLYTGQANVVDADFGYNWSGFIGDTVFYDTNANGVQDGGEAGVNNVTLALIWDQNGNGLADFGEPAIAAASTTTVATTMGQYGFGNLPPGKYVVQAAGQTVESPSKSGVFGTMVPTASYGEDYAVTLTTGAMSVLTADFGFVEAARVEGHVFYDANNSSVFDAGELGLGDGSTKVTVTLTGTDLSGKPVTKTIFTSATGAYSFLVPPGSYTVTYTDSQTTGLGYPKPTTVTSYSTSPMAGETVSHLDFGVTYNGSLGNRVWNDANGNGTQDTGELGIPGVTLDLFASNGTTFLRSVATDANGNYSFGGLADGSYVVKVIPPSGFTPTGEGDTGSSCQGPPNVCDNAITASISGGNVNNAVDFGYKTPGYTVSGNVWNDNGGSTPANAGNGTKDSGEPGITTVKVCLYQSDGVTVFACTTTDANGNYSFPGVPNGDYKIKVDPSTLPSGAFVQTGDPDGSKDNQTSIQVKDANVTDKNFGYQEKLGSIAGTVCFGTGNGQCDSGESPIAGVSLDLYKQDSNGIFQKLKSATTDASGAYSFTDLQPGNYQVIETAPASFLGSLADADGGNPDNISVTLAAGANIPGRDFEETASIGDYVWFDTNRNGIQEAEEKGIAGVTVKLRAAASGTLLQTTQTDGSGFYRFTGVSGSLLVEFAPPAGYEFSPPNAGSGALQDSFDSDANPATGQAAVTVSGASNVTIDAGLYLADKAKPARIGDFVWYDTNKDGKQDAGEPGLAGVTVRLLDPNNSYAVLATTTSDGNGFYEFAGLKAGSYVVEFGKPSGYTRTTRYASGATSPDAKGDDSDADASSGRTSTIVLTAGQNLTSVDAGLYIPDVVPAAIGDFVWYDGGSGTAANDANGIQDAGELGIPGVRVNLFDATGTVLIATTKTDATGHYGFGGLAAGSYQVEFVKPVGGYSFSPADAGTGPAQDSLDSDVDPTTGRISLTLTPGQTNHDIDAGLYVPTKAPITIGDFVWKDLNADKSPQSGEGLTGVQVVLYDSLGYELARLTTTATDTNYTFTGVPAGGSYRVQVDQSTLGTLVQIADPDSTLDNRTDLIAPTASNDLVDFGYLASNASIAIVKTASDDSDSQQVRSGGTASFKVTVTNNGNLTLSNVKVGDPLTPACDFTIASLAPGASSTVKTCSKTNVTSDFTNTANVEAQPVDDSGNSVGDMVTAQDGTNVDVIVPAIAIVKTATNSPRAEPF